MFVETVPATAGNIIYSFVPGTGLRWRIHRMRITLVNDATIANRIFRYRFYNTVGAGQETQTTLSSGNITASQTQFCGMTTAHDGTDVLENDFMIVHLHEPYVIDEAMSVSIDIVNGVAGDSYSGYAVIEEEPSGS